MKKIQESRGQYYRGLDFGFAVSYNALVEMVADRSKKELYIYSEYYSRGKKNSEIMEDIKHLRNRNYVIIADSAEPKTIKEFNDAGFRVLESIKGQGSVKTGIKKLQEFDKIYISDNCQNVWREFDTLEHPKNEQTSEIDEDKYNIDPHTVDAVRYALEQFRPFSYDLKNVRMTGY